MFRTSANLEALNLNRATKRKAVKLVGACKPVVFLSRASSETNDFDLEPMLVVVFNLVMLTPALNRFHYGHVCKTFVLGGAVLIRKANMSKPL